MRRMPLLLAGIDEAGYGPLLGPLCVGMSLFRVRDWSPGDPAPDVWKLLSTAVCKKPSDTRRRLPIADSKQIKLANDCKTHHPLVHLERGVLAFLQSRDGRCCATDHELLDGLGAKVDAQPWYLGDPTLLPLASTSGQVSIAAARLAGACEEAGVELLDLRCIIIAEAEFNDTIRRTGSKADATTLAVGRHLRAMFGREGFGAEDARIVCDQLGGRTQYEDLLTRELPGARVAPLAESDQRSRYSLSEKAIIQFMPEAESAHLPVALASMVAKLTRELAMRWFNRYWCARVPELKPTAGYSTDARRWLDEMREVLNPAERAAMVRIA